MFSSDDLKGDDYQRVLMMGPVKTGKTTTVVATSPGPVAVLLCEDEAALKGARRNSDKPFDIEKISSFDKMLKAIQEVKNAGKYKTCVVDPFSNFAYYLENVLREQHDNDARRWSPEYNNRLDHIVEQLFRLPMHVVVISHYIETGGEIDNQLAKTGEGIMPLLAGKARVLIPAKFNDVVWFDYLAPKKDTRQPWDEEPYNGRVIVTGPNGRWGPGCRSVHGTHIVPADMKLLYELFKKGASKSKSNGVAEGKTAPTPKSSSALARR